MILGLGGFAVFIAWDANHNSYYLGYSNRVAGVSVGYSLRASGEPEFIIVVRDWDGRPLNTIYSIYAWMPDGSIVSLGIYGGIGTIKANYSYLREFSKTWYSYIISKKSNPGMVLPGLILMGAVHEKNGVYDSIRGAPINTKEVLGNKTIVIEIREDLRSKKPIIETNQSQSSQTASLEKAELQSDWPPKYINAYCYWSTCFVWKLEEVYSSQLGVRMPIIATYVYGPFADKVHDVYLNAYYRSSSSFNVYIDFFATARVYKNDVSVEYRIPGPIFTLAGDNVWLNAYYSFYNGYHFTPPALVGLGLLSDIASAKYRLYQLYCAQEPPPVCTEIQTDTIADMTLMRAVISDNKMIAEPVTDKDPYNGQALKNAFTYYRNYWSWSQPVYSQQDITINVFKVQEDLFTTPTLTISGSVLGIICGALGGSVPLCSTISNIASIMGATVGATSSDSQFMYLLSRVALRVEYINTGYYISADYFYAPSKLLANDGNYYYIGSLYIDAYVSHYYYYE
ncbi:MAG: hypothetical protein DJ555_02600 [Desulfurococcaceae archaeon]|nr:MAG: hypothetical protein DJ555_02600 [Desulfurococcaceae archaeon]